MDVLDDALRRPKLVVMMPACLPGHDMRSTIGFIGFYKFMCFVCLCRVVLCCVVYVLSVVELASRLCLRLGHASREKETKPG